MSSPPQSPSLKDLPKVAPDLKSELEDFKPEKMKRASTQEKNVLPTAEGKQVFLICFIYLLYERSTRIIILW